MKARMTFKDLAKLQAEQLSKQPPLTYEQMLDSVNKVHQKKKQRSEKKSDKK